MERLSTVRTKTELEYAIDLKNIMDLHDIRPDIIEGGIISLVVPQITKAVELAAEKIIHCQIMVIGKGIDPCIEIQIDNPSQLGSDLIADAVAGLNEYHLPLAIFDMGTANTVCRKCVQKGYLKGSVLWGVIMVWLMKIIPSYGLTNLTDRSTIFPPV